MHKVQQSSVRFAMATALSLALCSHAAAADQKAHPNDQSQYGTTPWGGLHWGIGLAADFDLRGSRVGTAAVVNNIVRITDSSSNVGVGFVLEAHYFLRDAFFGGDGRKSCAGDRERPFCLEVAWGPFVAIEVGGGKAGTPSADSPITGYALGWMVGFRHPNVTKTSDNSSWNFGLGLRVDPKAQVLGDGIVANQPLPAGEPADPLRLKKVPRYGLMLLSSFSF
jgi:hypothetical protein